MSAPTSQSSVESATQVDAALTATRRLQESGYTAYWAGGCVRDRLRGVDPIDYDIATDARPDTVIELFPGATAVGKSFGVVVVTLGPWSLEVDTFRQDHDYHDGRHPERVTFVSPEEDASRRDFTINAMFYDPIADTYHDFVGGERDLAEGVIRCVGDANRRFAEDHLRMLRAVRFASRLGFAIDPMTADAIRAHASDARRISPERVQTELTRTLLEAQKPGQAILLLESLKLLPVILPEVADMRRQEQPPEFHPEGDVLTHTVMMLDAMEQRDIVLALATLLHDVGKPPTATHDGTRLRFNRHAEVGADIACTILTRLRYPTRVTDAVSHCIRNHMRFLDVQRMRRSTLRRLVGAATFLTELELHRLDCSASHDMLDNYDFLKAAQEEMANEPILPPPWLSGRDVMAMGVPEGPQIGKWLRIAYDAQLEGRCGSPEAMRTWLTERIEADIAI